MKTSRDNSEDIENYDDDFKTCPVCDGEGNTASICCSGRDCGCNGGYLHQPCEFCDQTGRVLEGVEPDESDYGDYLNRHNDDKANRLEAQREDAFKAKWKGES